jgi:hypothetical protein
VPHPLDEYPIHQAPLSMRYAATSDRAFYDRCYFNAHDRSGDIFLITGLGVYPHLGVIDAYASVGRGSRLVSVHASDALGEDRLDQRVGPYHIEVVEPLKRIRLVCDGDDHGVGFDLTFDGSFAAVEEPRHVHRIGDNMLLDACRFAQVGTWSGQLRVEGTSYDVTPDRWLGTRDRSWGIRPVGEPPPPGRWAAEGATQGFWWLYVPLRFEDFAIVVIVQENPDGHRVLNEAVRVWPDGRAEQLGWPELDIQYRSGTRYPERATIHCTDRNRKPVTIDVETLYSIPLGPGTGYGGTEWTHGLWKGRGWVEGTVHDWSDPALAALTPFMMKDHVARASCDGVEGWGLFEHTSVGRHDPTGFTDFTSTAP